ncbi:MAG TPA: hypothetical protein PKZ53_06405, partial [Acidobacteriota bacterium]|nr:hypothetical protein [Acidobacteriota bacterium]
MDLGGVFELIRNFVQQDFGVPHFTGFQNDWKPDLGYKPGFQVFTGLKKEKRKTHTPFWLKTAENRAPRTPM